MRDSRANARAASAPSALGDRVGLTWHPRLAAAILAARDRLDMLEVIPEGRFLESARDQRALRSLSQEIPMTIHGVSLGVATTSDVETKRLDALARIVDLVRPENWSEHLAFVRAGGIELGHLAAPVRTAATIDATARNLERARQIVGAWPEIENVATLLDPPGSTMSEQEWLQRLLATTGSDLLLDLHNLYANGLNFSFDPAQVIDALPADRIRTIHIAGGMTIAASNGETRLLDDHLHDVPDPVYALLERVAARAPHPLTVVLERDGDFPAFDVLLAQLDRARAAMATGRARQAAETM
jgi:uncharacterized protein (UPF0276 family)